LLKKKAALFICCGDPDPSNYFKSNYSETLFAHCFATLGLGGEMDVEKAKGFNKLGVKMAIKVQLKHGFSMPKISDAAISELAQKIKAA
jgi:hypothetical protein